MPCLPLGTSDFAALRRRGEVYVDKTALVAELASKPGRFFLARPRRFGKSLLVSTFESLFTHGLRDFRGLAIENLWREEGRYRVVRLDFSNVRDFASPEDFRSIFDDYLTDLMQREGLEAPGGMKTTGLRDFTNWLAVQPPDSVVLLVDEYDAPLTACLHEPEVFESVRKGLARFWAAVKNWDGPIRFLFITGILTFSRASVFPELNMLADISLDARFGTLLGFTRDEAEERFGDWIDRGAETLALGRKELMDCLAEHYGGCCFDERARGRLMAPWSVLNFLSRPDRGFRPYWVESAGSPAVLEPYLSDPGDYFSDKYLPFFRLGSVPVDRLALLMQTGWLTIRGVGTGAFLLDYPNREVSDAFARLYRNRLLGGRNIDELGAAELRAALLEGNADAAIEQLNRVLPAVDPQKYPIEDERAFRYCMQLILTVGFGVRTFSGSGSGVLEIEAPALHWSFEFKF